MTIAEVLKAAKALIEDPSRWTQRTFARTMNGDAVHGTDRLAVCWCAAGAVLHCSPRAAFMPVCVLNAAAQEMGFRTATELNDTAGHRAVMEMFDRAIQHADN